jgi:diguanylate cyclase (GGDEF)-like protein
VCIRTLDTGRLLSTAFPQMDFQVNWWIGWITMEVSMLLWVIVLKSAFPKYIPRWFVSTTAVAVIGAVLTNIFSQSATTVIEIGTYLRLYGLIVFCFSAYAIARGLFTGSSAGKFFAVGAIFLTGSAGFEALSEATRILPGFDASNYGFLIFVVFQTIYINRRYLAALDVSEALTTRLEDRVDERTEELRLANEKLQKQALRDTLTKLPNRRALQIAFLDAIKSLEGTQQSLCIAVVDADHFKKINDTYGHDVGDTVLVHLAQTLKDSLRDIDVVARIGGEEFAIMMTMNDIEGVLRRIETTRMQVCDNKFNVDEYELNLSVSIGVALVRQGDSLQTALKRADEALYQAKGKGRNCVRLALSG